MLASVTAPDGSVWRFEYAEPYGGALPTAPYLASAYATLTAVILPDETLSTADNPRRTYHYEDSLSSTLLTGITDERDIRTRIWDFDSDGRGFLSTGPAGANDYAFTFNTSSTVVTNPFGRQETFSTTVNSKGLTRPDAGRGERNHPRGRLDRGLSIRQQRLSQPGDRRAGHRGEPLAMTDASRAKVWDAAYEPFGAATVFTATTALDLRLPGQQLQAETGLHQNWMRDYDPMLGRYLQPDPIGLDGGPNVYSYVGQDPLNYVDPSGELAWLIPVVRYGVPALVGGGIELAQDSGAVHKISAAADQTSRVVPKVSEA